VPIPPALMAQLDALATETGSIPLAAR
jgi:hypothetical protein